MFVIRLIGGVGNQLFQYTFGQFLKHKFGVEVCYDIVAFDTVDKGRNLELQLLDKSLPLFETSNFFFSKYKSWKKRLFLYGFLLKKNNKYYTKYSPEEISLFTEKGLSYFDGWWQYPALLRDTINNMEDFFIPKQPIPVQIQKYYTEILSNNFAVALHVRRGDYFTSKYAKTYAVCNVEYYTSAVNLMCEKLRSCKFYVFSDDLDWVKSNLILPSNTIYVKNYNINSYWYIYLMSLCRNIIISNSSFSWWGATLNRNLHKIVIAPKYWSTKKNNTLCDNSWIKI